MGYIKEILTRIKFHNVMVNAAGIAFYGLLALIPTLIALVSVYALVADPAEIETQVTDAAGSLDEDTQSFIVGILEGIVGDVKGDAESAEGSGGGVAGFVGRVSGLAFGLLFALFSASGAVQKLMGTINLAYETLDSRPGWKVRGLAYLFTAGAIVGLALMAFSISALPQILDRVELGGVAETVINLARLPVLAALFGGALTILYRYGPDRSPRTPWKNPGAVVAMVLFVVFAIGFSFYSSNVGAMPAAYGLLGTIAALMIFLQLTALSVIIGAEVNGALEVGPLLSDNPAGAGAPAQSAVGSARSATMPTAARGVTSSPGATESSTGESLSFGKAMAGLVAMYVLGRGASKGN